MDGLKAVMLEFQNQFSLLILTHIILRQFGYVSNYHLINGAINKNIPQAISKTQKHLSWLNSAIRKKMQKRKHLYNKAKSTGSEEVWLSYRKIRNKIK